MLDLPPVRTAKARGPEKSLPSCAHWPFNVRPEGFYRGAFELGPEQTKEAEEAEPEEEMSREKVAASPEALATFLAAAISQFEEQFAITPEEKLHGVRLFVKDLKPKAPRTTPSGRS